MPTTVFVQRRKWLRLPVSIPASLTHGNGRHMFDASILNLSENGIGFTLDANVQDLDEMIVSFWLPFEHVRPCDTMFEPIVVRITPVSSRYVVTSQTYEYGAVFLGLTPNFRYEIRRHLARIRADVGSQG